MEFQVKDIAAFLGGTVEGDTNLKINTICEIDKGKANALSFLANAKYTPHIYTTKATAVVVANSFVAEHKIDVTLIKVEDPYQSFAKVLAQFDASKADNLKGISENCKVDPTASIGKNVYVGDFTCIGKNVRIGENVKIHPQVFIGNNVTVGNNTTLFQGAKVYYDSIIGENCIIHAGTVIGADGFGFAPTSADYQKVPQVGNVIIENHVEIGANSCIDRATIGSTIIRKGVKLDNLIQIGHNVEIDENTVIAAQTGIAGSTKIGKNIMMGGQVGVAGHINVADGTKVGAQSGIASNVKKENEVMMGSPAYAYADYKRSYIVFKRLPDIHKKIIQLEKQLKELKESSII